MPNNPSTNPMSLELSSSSAKVAARLAELGVDAAVTELAASTRTADDAASAVGARVEQIAKSMIFETAHTNRAILVITGGRNRVDERKLEALIGERVGRASPEFVRERTGYAIGGVPPVAHATEIEAILDEDLLAESEIFAAAGTPRSLFAIAPRELLTIAGARVAEIKQ
jgi:prolyl-tRNA editing enzyme YbaK/EbsC (Cys-tRNA(Pro) deacylase)